MSATKKRKDWRPFEEAREYVRSLRLKSQAEWMKYSKSGKCPSDIPTVPQKVYQDEWRGLPDWLGYKRSSHPVGGWRPFEKAREYVRGLGLKGMSEWQAWAKTDQRPEDIPASPRAFYRDEWRGYGDWLGTANQWTRVALLALLEDLRARLPYLEEQELYAILQQGGAMPTLIKRFGKGSPLKVLKDLKENDGHGIEDALRENNYAKEGSTYDIVVEETTEVDHMISADAT